MEEYSVDSLNGNDSIILLNAFPEIVCQLLGVPRDSIMEDPTQLEEEEACLSMLWAGLQTLRTTDATIATVLNNSEKAAAASAAALQKATSVVTKKKAKQKATKKATKKAPKKAPKKATKKAVAVAAAAQAEQAAAAAMDKEHLRREAAPHDSEDDPLAPELSRRQKRAKLREVRLLGRGARRGGGGGRGEGGSTVHLIRVRMPAHRVHRWSCLRKSANRLVGAQP